MDTRKNNKWMLIVTIIATFVGVLGFSWGLAKDFAKTQDYNNVSKSLNECKIENEKLILAIDSLNSTCQQVIIGKDESKSIADGKVLVKVDYQSSYNVSLDFVGADGISDKKEGYYSTYTYCFVEEGKQIFLMKDNNIWLVNVLEINPVILESIKIK